MSNKMPLYKKLLEIGGNQIEISSLKEFYTPLDLAQQLKSLEQQDLIIVNWKSKVIGIKLDIKKLIAKKKELNKDISKIPEYMNDNKIEINKPFLEIKKGEQD